MTHVVLAASEQCKKTLKSNHLVSTPPKFSLHYRRWIMDCNNMAIHYKLAVSVLCNVDVNFIGYSHLFICGLRRMMFGFVGISSKFV